MLRKLRQNKTVVFLFIFFASLYIYTAAPGVYDGDTGEIAAAVNELGLAHPTGFPLYILSGKLFTLLVPIGDVAYRLNIFSALLTATSVVLVYFLLRSLEIEKTPALLASVVFGLGRNTIWANAGVASIYALSLFLALVLLNIFAQWQRTQKSKFLFLYAGVFGLSLGGHLTMIVMVLPFLMMLWQEFESHRSVSTTLKAISISVIPLAQYLYLWVAYTRNTVVTWGSMASFKDFVGYIRQSDYAYKISARTWDDSMLFFGTLSGLLQSEFTLIFLLMVVCGLAVLLNKNKTLMFFLLILAGANIGMLFLYGNNADLFVLPRYIFIVYIVFTIALAYFFDALFSSINSWKGKKYGILLAIIAIAPIGWQYSKALAYNNRHDNFVIPDFAENAFSSVGRDAIFVTQGDPITGPAWYSQSIGNRTDIVIVSGDLLRYDWYIQSMVRRHPDIISDKLLEIQGPGNRLAQVLKDNISKREIYTIANELNNQNATNFELVPTGVVNRVVLRGSDVKKVLETNRSWQNYRLRNVRAGVHKSVMVDNMTKYYLLTFNNTAMVYARNGFLDEAEQLLQKSLEIGRDPRVEANLNGVLEQKLSAGSQ